MATVKKKKTFYEDFKDCHDRCYRIVNDDFFEEFGEKLMETIENSDGAGNMVLAVRSLGVPWSTYCGWVVKYPKVKQINEECKIVLGSIRSRNGHRRVLDPTYTRWSCMAYCPDHVEAYRLQKKVDSEEQRKVEIVRNLITADNAIKGPDDYK